MHRSSCRDESQFSSIMNLCAHLLPRCLNKSSQELLPKYTEQERQLTCPEGVCVQAVFQQPELRGMSARARPRVTLRMVLVLFAELFFLLWISIIFCARPC